MSVSGQKVVHAIQLTPEKLAGLGNSVSMAALGAGCDADTVENLVQNHIRAECVLCGLKISGDEVKRLASAENIEPGNSKIARLRLGFCGRSGCDSKYYSVEFFEHSILSWPSIVPSPDSVANTPELPVLNTPTNECKVVEFQQKSLLPKPVVRLLLALALLFIGIQIVRHFTGGRIPILQPKHNYSINPDSVRTPKN